MRIPSRSHIPERRRSARVPVRDHVKARVDDVAQDVTIVDLSNGGFLLESAQPFLVGSIHQFRIALQDGRWMTMLTARSMHAGPSPDVEPERYRTGFSFVEPLGSEAHERVHALVEHVTSVVAF